jgi:cob(I)alamin adenosyltransferase
MQLDIVNPYISSFAAQQDIPNGNDELEKIQQACEEDHLEAIQETISSITGQINKLLSSLTKQEKIKEEHLQELIQKFQQLEEMIELLRHFPAVKETVIQEIYPEELLALFLACKSNEAYKIEQQVIAIQKAITDKIDYCLTSESCSPATALLQLQRLLHQLTLYSKIIRLFPEILRRVRHLLLDEDSIKCLLSCEDNDVERVKAQLSTIQEAIKDKMDYLLTSESDSIVTHVLEFQRLMQQLTLYSKIISHFPEISRQVRHLLLDEDSLKCLLACEKNDVERIKAQLSSIQEEIKDKMGYFLTSESFSPSTPLLELQRLLQQLNLYSEIISHFPEISRQVRHLLLAKEALAFLVNWKDDDLESVKTRLTTIYEVIKKQLLL